MSRCVLAVLLVLAACASEPEYVRPGVSDERRAADLRACRAEAERLVERDRRIDRDIQAARPEVRGGRVEGFTEETRNFGRERRFERIVAECMRARGYELAT